MLQHHSEMIHHHHNDRVWGGGLCVRARAWVCVCVCVCVCGTSYVNRFVLSKSLWVGGMLCEMRSIARAGGLFVSSSLGRRLQTKVMTWVAVIHLYSRCTIVFHFPNRRKAITACHLLGSEWMAFSPHVCILGGLGFHSVLICMHLSMYT